MTLRCPDCGDPWTQLDVIQSNLVNETRSYRVVFDPKTKLHVWDGQPRPGIQDAGSSYRTRIDLVRCPRCQHVVDDDWWDYCPEHRMDDDHIRVKSIEQLALEKL